MSKWANISTTDKERINFRQSNLFFSELVLFATEMWQVTFNASLFSLQLLTDHSEWSPFFITLCFCAVICTFVAAIWVLQDEPPPRRGRPRGPRGPPWGASFKPPGLFRPTNLIKRKWIILKISNYYLFIYYFIYLFIYYSLKTNLKTTLLFDGNKAKGTAFERYDFQRWAFNLNNNFCRRGHYSLKKCVNAQEL